MLSRVTGISLVLANFDETLVSLVAGSSLVLANYNCFDGKGMLMDAMLLLVTANSLLLTNYDFALPYQRHLQS